MCREERNASKSFSICRLPDTLIIHLKRQVILFFCAVYRPTLHWNYSRQRVAIIFVWYGNNCQLCKTWRDTSKYMKDHLVELRRKISCVCNWDNQSYLGQQKATLSPKRWEILIFVRIFAWKYSSWNSLSHIRYSQSGVKITAPVEFPVEELDMAEFTKFELGAGEFLYDLIGCVCHEGSKWINESRVPINVPT